MYGYATQAIKIQIGVLYDNRRLSPLIFDWLYYRLKKQNEEEMNKGTKALIQELL
ncbi:S-4TM family putative pore-forming effector [Okeanomitos corallinicola]|uniref:S-4TM family putative pore-forming effector n=1 Tax=Okeanomitos corallinicola TaxID=3231550 RepID=UPI00338FAD93